MGYKPFTRCGGFSLLTFFPTAEVDFWASVLTYADLARLDEAGFAVGGRHYGVYGHDWRTVPPVAWLALLGDREVGAGDQTGVSRPAAQVIVLSQSDFTAAVRAALRDFVRPDQLRGNALVHSRLVLARAGETASDDERALALQALLHDAAAALQASPRTVKLFRALHHTYFQPDGVRAFFRMLDSAFSDLNYSVEDILAEGDKVCWRWVMQGKHTGIFQGVPPTGKSITVAGMDIARLEQGQLVEHWGEQDMLGLMQQLSLAPGQAR